MNTLSTQIPFQTESTCKDDLNYHIWRHKKYQALLTEEIRPTDIYLDAGCQEGILLWSLPACRKFGIDINNQYLRLAKKRNPDADLSVGNIENFPYPDSFFDIVSCTEVIEHVDDPEKGLREIKRVLKKDGLLLLSTYNHYNLFNLMTLKAFSKTPRLHCHPREYSWESITGLLAGYFILEKVTQAGNNKYLDLFYEKTKLPVGDFMIITARKS